MNAVLLKGVRACDEVTACMRTVQSVSSGLGLCSFHHCAIGATPYESLQMDHNRKWLP
jgi:hypothetical protein